MLSRVKEEDYRGSKILQQLSRPIIQQKEKFWYEQSDEKCYHFNITTF